MKLIAGLGNPDAKYSSTRHNLGFLVLDLLAKMLDADWGNPKSNYGWEAKIELNKERLILLKPSTYMNLSGQAVGQAARFYKINPEDIWVVHDDLDLLVGTLRIRPSGSSGGHNGLKSIIESLDSEDFARFRLGIKPVDGSQRIPAEDFVLQEFTTAEKALVAEAIQRAVDAIRLALTEGLPAAMNRYSS